VCSHFSATGNEEMFRVTNPVTATGVLKGFDQLLNLVLDDVQEIFQTGPSFVFPFTSNPPALTMCSSFTSEQNPNKRCAASVWLSCAVPQSPSSVP